MGEKFVQEISYNHSGSFLTVVISGKIYTYRLAGEFQHERFQWLVKLNQGRALAYLRKVGELVKGE